jgi:predicted secreted hydrolase
MKLRTLILGTFTLLATLAVACGGNSETNVPLVTLPADEGPHDSVIEWWYFNGLFTDDQGQEYSYHYVTFQNEATGTAVPHLLQASLGVHTTGEHLTGERVLLDVLDPDAVGVDVEVNGWEMLGDGEFYSLEFDLGGYLLDLKAIPTRPPILHQGVGLVSLGPAGDTFYYSRTRLDLTGSITVDGKQRPITGAAWMDHQWGDVVGQRVGWDWASVQLDDGSDLMAVLVWDPADRTPFAGYGTLVSPDGTVITAKQEDVSISSSAIWTSPETGIEYPSGWTISIPTLGLSLELEPVLVNAEFAGSRYNPAAYWEGEVRVTGTRQGEAVGGRGFVELVGYDPGQIEP